MQPKAIKPSALYNKLQDLRHIIVLDYRSPQAYSQSHIRNSINLSISTPEADITQIIYQYEKKYTQTQEKYKTKRIRRIVLLNSPAFNIQNQIPKKWAKQIEVDKELEGYQLMVLSEDYETFNTKYPYLCLANPQVYGGNMAQDQKSKSLNLTEYQRKMLYSMSKFPTQIIQNELYLGDIWNSNNTEQLKDLNIKTIIDFVGYNEQQVVPNFKTTFNYIPMPMNAKAQINIDFDGFNRMVDQIYSSNQGPILMHCRDGNEFAPAFAIAYLMWRDKKPFQITSLKVFQALSSADICKWIYTQIMIYNPKKPA